jgi:putative membrane protein
MRRKVDHRFGFEALEDRTLLAGNVPLLSSVPGGGTSTPTSTADMQAMQQDASSNNMELLMAQTELLLGTRTDVQQYAALLMRDHRDAGFSLHSLADSRGVILPSGFTGSDRTMAIQFLNDIKGSGATNIDTTFLNDMVQSHTQTIATVQQQISAATDPGFKAFLQTILPSLQQHLTLAQSLLAGPTTITPSTPPSSGTSTLSTGDTQILTQSYSSNWLDRYLSQVASLVGLSQSQSSQDSFQLYTQKLITDHTQGMYEEEEIAQGTNTPLPAGLDTNDAQTASQLLSSLGTSQQLANAEQAYLTTMVQAHQQDITNNTQALSTVQNPSLMQVIQDDLPTDNLHLQGAQTQLSMIQFPNPQGHHAQAVVRAYQKDFGRNPTWDELFYWTNTIRANPKSQAWIRQLAKTQNGTISYSTSNLGYYGASTGTTATKTGTGSSALKLGRAGKTTGTTKTATKTTGTTTAASHAKTKVAQVHYGVSVLGRSAKARHS